MAQHRSNDASKRLRSIPGIGIVGATAVLPPPFRTRRHSARVRDFAAWIRACCRAKIQLARKQKLKANLGNKATNI